MIGFFIKLLCVFITTVTLEVVVNQIISAAIQYDLDGINLDFESLNSEAVGDSCIQFIRELSLKCANNGVVLSVDNYVPSAYTAFYDREEQANFADYVVISPLLAMLPELLLQPNRLLQQLQDQKL